VLGVAPSVIAHVSVRMWIGDDEKGAVSVLVIVERGRGGAVVAWRQWRPLVSFSNLGEDREKHTSVS